MSPGWKSSRNAPGSFRKGEDVAEPAAAPVILRWQDLGKVPDFVVIIKAPEEKNLPRGKGKGKEKGKGKAQIGDNKAKGPPLANYIKASEFSLACKMCCNTDYHATFQCPNLTPELKEYLKEARSKCAKFKPYHPDDKTCHICLKKGDHWTSACSYLHHYPAGAIVGPSAAIVCKCCGDEDAHPGKPGVDWDAKVFARFVGLVVVPVTTGLKAAPSEKHFWPQLLSRQVNQRAQLLALSPPCQGTDICLQLSPFDQPF